MKVLIFDFNRTLFDPDRSCLNEGVSETLTELKKRGFVMILMAKGNKTRERLIEELALTPYFHHVLVKHEKSLEDFQSIQKLFPSADFYSIGDRIKKEILFGNALGMITVWFKHGKFAKELPESSKEEPTHTILKLSDLLTLL